MSRAITYRFLALLGSAVLGAGLLAPPSSASTATRTQLPVTYSFLQDVLSNGQRSSAPGANDFSCRPSRNKPRPVVLVHGTFGNAATNWGTYSALLANHGYCVFALTYGDVPATQKPTKLGGMADMRTSARQLARFVAKVRRTSGAKKVDLLGHSQGTLMPNYYVRFLGGHKFVKRYISLAPLWHGEGGASAERFFKAGTAFGARPDAVPPPICTACGQMSAGSGFMKKMRAGRIAHKSVSYTNIVTRHDDVVLPYTSGIQTGYRNMRNIVLQNVCGNDFSDHLQIAASANAAQLVLNTLAPAHAQPVRCRLTTPLG